MPLVVVKCNPCLAHMRGKRMVVGGSGREYEVDSDSLKLHLVVEGSPAVEAGCHPDDAKRLGSIPYSYTIVPTAAPPKPKKAKAVVAKPVEPDPEPIVAEKEPETEPDLSILDSSVSKLRSALETGDFDDALADLLAAEEAGKTRKSAVEVIQERMNQR